MAVLLCSPSTPPPSRPRAEPRGRSSAAQLCALQGPEGCAEPRMSVCPYVHVSVCPCPCAPRGPHPPPPPAPTLGVVQPPQKFRGGGGGRIAGFSPCQPVSLRCARSPSARRCISLPPPTPMHSPKGQKGRSPGVPEAGGGGCVPVLRYSLSLIPKVRGQGAALTPFLCLQGTTKKCLPRPTPRTSAGASPPAVAAVVAAWGWGLGGHLLAPHTSPLCSWGLSDFVP